MTKYLVFAIISSLVQPVAPNEKPKRLNKEVRDKIKTLYVLPDNVVMDIQAYQQFKKDSSDTTKSQYEAWREGVIKPNKWALFKSRSEITEWYKDAIYFEGSMRITSKEKGVYHTFCHVPDLLLSKQYSWSIETKPLLNSYLGRRECITKTKYWLEEGFSGSNKIYCYPVIIDSDLIVKDVIDPKVKSFIAIRSKDQWTVYNADKFKCTEEKMRELIRTSHPLFNWKWNSSKKYWEKQIVKVPKP